MLCISSPRKLELVLSNSKFFWEGTHQLHGKRIRTQPWQITQTLAYCSLSSLGPWAQCPPSRLGLTARSCVQSCLPSWRSPTSSLLCVRLRCFIDWQSWLPWSLGSLQPYSKLSCCDCWARARFVWNGMKWKRLHRFSHLNLGVLIKWSCFWTWTPEDVRTVGSGLSPGFPFHTWTTQQEILHSGRSQHQKSLECSDEGGRSRQRLDVTY